MDLKTINVIPKQEVIAYDFSPDAQFLITCAKYQQTPDNFEIWDLNTFLVEGSHEWTSTIKDSIRYVKWSSDSKYMARTSGTQSKIIQIFNSNSSFSEPEATIELEKVSYFDFVPRTEEN